MTWENGIPCSIRGNPGLLRGRIKGVALPKEPVPTLTLSFRDMRTTQQALGHQDLSSAGEEALCEGTQQV